MFFYFFYLNRTTYSLSHCTAVFSLNDEGNKSTTGTLGDDGNTYRYGWPSSLDLAHSISLSIIDHDYVLFQDYVTMQLGQWYRYSHGANPTSKVSLCRAGRRCVVNKSL